MKLTREDQTAVLLRARELLAMPDGWMNRSRLDHRQKRQRYVGTERFTLGEACQRAAFELGLSRMRNGSTYTVALATGLLNELDRWDHRSLAGFNDDPMTHKVDVLALVDRRITELL